MTHEEIKSEIEKIIIDRLGVDENEIVDDADLRDDLDSDSLDLVEIVMDCERKFEIEITDENIEKIIYLKDLYEQVQIQIDKK